MKVRIIGPLLRGISCKLQLSGHEIVEELSPDQEDVCIKESEEVPSSVVDSLGYKTVPVKPDYFISKHWSATSWSPESLLTVPIQRLAPGGLGPEASNGCASKRIESPTTERLFSEPRLEEFVKLVGHVGFVSFGIVKEQVVGLHLGIPGFGVYGFAGMQRGSLVDHFCEGRLRSSWMVSLVLSKWPYPNRDSIKPYWVDTGQSLSHFWPFCKASAFVGSSFQTQDTLVGVATSYGTTLEHALWFTELTCRKIEVEQKQFYQRGLRELEWRVGDVLRLHAAV